MRLFFYNFKLLAGIIAGLMVSLSVTGESLVEGTVLRVSRLPVPEKSDYPNCNYTLEFKVNSIISGEPVPPVLQLVLPGFVQYKLLPSAKIKSGDKLRLHLVPFGSLDPTKKTTQQADDLCLFELDNYFSEDAVTIASFNYAESIVPFKGDISYVSIYANPCNTPIKAEYQVEQAKRIADNLSELTARINAVKGKEKAINFAFNEAWEKERKKYKVVDYGSPYAVGRVGKTYVSLQTTPFLLCKSVSVKLIDDDTMAGIREFKNFLAAHGVQFILLLFPDRSDIAARIFIPRFSDIPDITSASMVKQLLENDIEAVYTADAILAQAQNYPFLFFYPFISHPMDGAQEALTSLAADRLTRFSAEFTTKQVADRFSIVLSPNIFGASYHWQDGLPAWKKSSGEIIPCENILYDGKALQYDEKSPILVIGNSYSQTPMAEGGFPARLAMKTKIIPHYFRIQGVGAVSTIPIEIAKNPLKYLEGKKVCLLPIPYHYLQEYFVNLKKMDESRLLLTGKQEVYNFTDGKTLSEGEIEKILTVGKSFPSFLDFIRNNKNDISNWGICTGPAQKKASFLELKIPDNLCPSRPSALVIHLAFPQFQMLDIAVNDVNQQVLMAYQLQWRRLIIPLVPDCKTIDLKISGKNAFPVLIRDIKLYQ